MTTDPSTLPAGAELDAAVLAAVVHAPHAGQFGGGTPRFSRDGTAALALLNTLMELDPETWQSVRLWRDAIAPEWECRIEGRTDGEPWYCRGIGKTPMLAICRALLDVEVPT